MSVLLEDFSTLVDHRESSVTLATPEELDAAKAEAYEAGFAAGWDDALRTESDSQAKVGAEFARHLQEMSFTFHEARAHVIESLQPLLHEVLQTVLPNLVQETLGQRILDVLDPLIQDAADQPITIAVAQGCREFVEPYLDSAAGAILEVVEEPTLTSGQAYLRLGKVERKVDLTEALGQIKSALNALSSVNERALKHA